MRNGERAVGKDIVEEKKFVEKDLEIEIENFYEKEAEFLAALYNLNKEEAQKLIRRIIKQVKLYTTDKHLEGLRYYFITVFGIVSRSMREQSGSLKRAFSYNAITIALVDKKLTLENAEDIADELIEFYIYMIASKSKPKMVHNTVNQVIEYIDQEIESAMTVEGLAKKFEVSTSHLSRIFRENTGVTLVEYINIKKVEESQYYLRFSDKKINEISNYFNFCNQSYYTRTFKKYTGKTPKRFRSNITNNYFKFKLPSGNL